MINDNALLYPENEILIVELDDRLEFSTIHPMSAGGFCVSGGGCQGSGNLCIGGWSCAGA
ncbi:MAG: hypothetical protein ABSF70_10590 [Terracidiphilus sp.]